MDTCDCKNPMACLQVNRCLAVELAKPDAPPTNWDELCVRQARNVRIEGQFTSTTMYMCCPGCGAPDWLAAKPFTLGADGMPDMKLHQQYNEGAVCKECERGFRMPITVSENETRWTIVQTSGPDLPDWYKLPIKRERRAH